MLAKADEEQLQRVCGSEETLLFARKLVPLARARTKQGSGHHIPDLATGLPAICAYVASNHLNNDDVTFENARQATCLQTKAFDRALRTLSVVLSSELKPKKGANDATYDTFHEIYGVELPCSTLVAFLRQAEHALVQLDARHKVGSAEVRYGIFFWACSTIKVKNFPTLEEFAQDNKVLSKQLAPTIKILSEKCNTLTTKLLQATKNTSRPPSPSKALTLGTPRTPRRSPTKPLRELPTRESVKKQRQASATAKSSCDLDGGTAPPETPTKKRKLDASSPNPSSQKYIQFPPATPSAHHISRLTSPSKTKVNPTPAIPSPLRRATRFMLQQEVDADVESDDEEEIAEVNRSLEADLAQAQNDYEGLRAESIMIRRFRPVYQDYKQWLARDARVVRLWKDAAQNDDELGVEV